MFVAQRAAEAQEVKFIDLSSLTQRTVLRHPPALASPCTDGHCVGGGTSSVSIADGGPDRRDPHALGIYLLRIAPTDIDPAQPFEVEFQVRNTGTVPLEIPDSPHLSDLQPADEGVAFSYFSLALVVEGEGEPQGPKDRCMGFVELYGSPEHVETMMELKPGEWIRVRANVNLRSWPPEPVAALFRGNFWLRRNTFRAQPGGESREIHNLYPNATSTPAIPVRLVRPGTILR